MQNNNKIPLFMEQDSWLNCIGELMNKNNIVSVQQQVLEVDSIFLNATNHYQYSLSQNLKNSIQTQLQEPNENQQQAVGKRSHYYLHQSQHKEQNIQQNFQSQILDKEYSQQQSIENEKQSRVIKQSQYAKNYRWRKKQLLKTLQEQNLYLKQKIKELQMRLKERQLQINRLKYAPEQKQLSVEQLNEQFLKKANLLMSKTSHDPLNYSKTVCFPEQKFYTEFMNSYDEHGFGGTRKKNTLNYYFNELLLSIMRDSEKYLFLVCNDCKLPQQIQGLQKYGQIDFMFKQIMQLDQAKKQRIKHLSNGLHPFMHEIKAICTDFYNDFNKILIFVDKVHNFMKTSYPHNMDFARKRIQLQNWFEHSKHRKLIRRLRCEWLQSMKDSGQEEAERKNLVKKKKKTKTTEIVKENP